MRWVKVATEMSSLVSMLFRTFLNPLKFLMEIFNILCISARRQNWRNGGELEQFKAMDMAYFKVRSATMFPKGAWSLREGKAS